MIPSHLLPKWLWTASAVLFTASPLGAANNLRGTRYEINSATRTTRLLP